MTDSSRDPQDETQPHDVDAYRTAVGGYAASGAGASSAASASYSPTPDPRSSWGGGHWAGSQPTPERWFETAHPVQAQPAARPAPSRAGTGPGTVIVAALAAALLASGGTVAVLDATGAFDRTASPAASTTANPNTAGSVRQPVTLDESSAIIDVASKAGPSVVRIYTEGIDPNSIAQQPTQGVGSGIIFDANGWILTNRHVVAGANNLKVELKDG
jgi:hypothetical protein